MKNLEFLSEEEKLAMALGRSIINGMRDAGMVSQPPVVPPHVQLDSNLSQNRPIFG